MQERQVTIYVVDDQEPILGTVKSVLTDESYRVVTFASAEELLEGLAQGVPDLVLLDIWLPGIDGVEALARLQKTHPDLPVILMSGHAGIDVAVNAMQSGAADFLEKPINLDNLLGKIAKHLRVGPESGPQVSSVNDAATSFECAGDASFVSTQEKQKTLSQNAVLNGVGLLSGKPTGIIITPAPVDSGIMFRTLDGVSIPGHISSLENFESLGKDQPFSANSTVLAKNGRRVRTVEHLLAALNMMGITNANVKVDGEIPNVDGSAVDYCRIIEEAGIQEQSAPRREIVIHKKIAIGAETQGEKHLYVEPFDGFEVNMRIDFPAPIHEQTYCFRANEGSFREDIAPARSFNTFENIDTAQKSGAVGSGYLNSHIIIHDGEVINTKLNFPDEFVRHKILDLLGDLYLLGHGIRGRVVGNMTSHGLNQTLAVKIYQALSEGRPS